MSSLTRFPTMGKVYYRTPDFPNNIISEQHIHNYKKIYGSPVLIEYDHRFYNRTEVEKESHKKIAFMEIFSTSRLISLGVLRR